MEGGGHLGLYGWWVLSILSCCPYFQDSSFANVPSPLIGDASMNSGNRKALLFHFIAVSKEGMQTRSHAIHGKVVFGYFRPDFPCLPSSVELSRSDFEVLYSIHIETSHFCLNLARVSHLDMRHRRQSHSYCIVILNLCAFIWKFDHGKLAIFFCVKVVSEILGARECTRGVSLRIAESVHVPIAEIFLTERLV